MLVLATVGVPPVTATAPPLMRMVPAALRLSVIVLSSSSPNTVSLPAEKDALTAMIFVSRVVPQRGLWLIAWRVSPPLGLRAASADDARGTRAFGWFEISWSGGGSADQLFQPSSASVANTKGASPSAIGRMTRSRFA